MAVRIFSIFLLCSAIKYILTQEYLYHIHDVDSITKGKITRYAKRQIRTACLLECRHNENCDKPYFKEDKVEKRFGECWFVKEGGGDELQLLKLSDGDQMETYEEKDITKWRDGLPTTENVSYCDTVKPCKYGRCENTYDGTQHKCHCNVDDWKLQTTNVCFGARDDSYGNFTLRHTGTLKKLKLQHTGETTLNCYVPGATGVSLWGCDYTNEQEIWTAITDINNVIIFPNSNPKKYYYLSGYHGNSPYLEFDHINKPAIKGDELRIWYLPDLRGLSENYRSGSSCADVYAVFCD
ncbi:uncharacterized protein LOC130625618 [Hydractinia symbiolongicarpus]|uniref:uncharacterized protein LOC130625618 n=1 Tax=Hydractinia symbiolongicarpus TaxID=13093 RepID=UPI00254BA57A|nr:uncharacterized protein LOC130625618 [Hydractinia symbiolongicarpus]